MKQANTFIFQSVPDRFDLARELAPGKTDTWYATRYRNEMNPGDFVYFWMAGEKASRGLYGWGVLTSAAYAKEGWDSHGVDVQYEVRFKKPILAVDLQGDSTLSDLLVLRAPQATNFLLTDVQASALIALVGRRHEESPAQSKNK